MLSESNNQLRAEVAQLTSPNGVLDQVVRHIRRIDGEGQAFRGQLASALGLGGNGPDTFDGTSGYAPNGYAPYDTDATARAPEAVVGGARHQIVTKSAGAAPGVTQRMSDVPVPAIRPDLETASEDRTDG